MVLEEVTKRSLGGRTRLSGRIRRREADTPVELYFEYPARFEPFVSDRADAFVPTLLLPAMATGEDLEIVDPVSPLLLSQLDTLQDIFHQWFPEDLKRVGVRATPREAQPGPSPQHIGSFFSLGVDSFYTLLKHRSGADAVTHLIYIIGVEKPLEIYDHGQENAVIERIEEVAADSGKECIIGETNLRDIFPLGWGPFYHGAGLAGVAHSLAAGFESVLIPSSSPYQTSTTWGSSPLTDPLWSTEATRIGHDGAEVNRAEKVADFLIHDAHAMKYMRVCVRNDGGVTNCGRCNKCVRTMLTLHNVGNLAQAASFPDRLPRDYARLVPVGIDGDHSLIADDLALARQVDADPAVIMSLSRKLRQSKVQEVGAEGSFFEVQREVFTWYFGTRLVQKLKTWYARPSSAWLRPWYRRARSLIRQHRRNGDA